MRIQNQHYGMSFGPILSRHPKCNCKAPGSYLLNRVRIVEGSRSSDVHGPNDLYGLKLEFGSVQAHALANYSTDCIRLSVLKH